MKHEPTANDLKMILALEESIEKLDKISSLYAFISQVNQNIVRVKDEATLYRNACRMALEYGKFKVAWIGMFDPTGIEITLVDQCGILADELKPYNGITFEANTAQSYVFNTCTHYICNDIATDLQFENWKPYAIENDIRSCIILPIRKAGKVVGTFNLYATKLNFTDKEEIALLTEVATDISFALDIFENDKKRKSVELELEAQNKELLIANEELDRFVYSASHDLRSPLTSILGLSTLIEDDTKEINTLEYARMIRTSVVRLDGFIKNILSYSQNNRTELTIERISLQKNVEQVVHLLRNIKEADGIRFDIKIIEQYPFYSDIQRFDTIIENFISNAIKYHKQNVGGRFIKVIGIAHEYNLHLRIEDNGIGIAPINQQKIFDMFFRISGKVAGSGIGLYIVKQTIEKLQGTIDIISEEGTGTCFVIKLKNLSHEHRATHKI